MRRFLDVIQAALPGLWALVRAELLRALGLALSGCAQDAGMKPYYQDGKCVIYNADCREYLPELRADAVITDPPYGIVKNSGRRLHAYKDNAKSGGRIGGTGAAKSTAYGDTTWDEAPLDAETWAMLQRISQHQIVWGASHLFGVLGKPPRWLVWDKKERNGWNDSFSDCEFAWCSDVGPDRMYRHLWMGMLRKGDEQREHPTQKPLALMRWCVEFFPDADLILDPFMGSGTTLLAAKEAGRRAVGFEVQERYCEIAAKRLSQETLGLIA